MIVGAVVVVALVSIGIVIVTSNDDQPSPSPSPQPTVSAPTTAAPSPSPTASAEQTAITGATSGYKAWRSVQDRVAMSGGTDAAESLLASVATDPELDVDRFIANTYYKARGRKMIRPGTIVSITPSSVGNPGTNGTITQVTLSVCRDVSRALIVQNGKSTKTPSSPTHLIDTAKMILMQGRWKATDVTDKQSKGACS